MFLKKCFFKLELKYANLFPDMDVFEQHNDVIQTESIPNR